MWERKRERGGNGRKKGCGEGGGERGQKEKEGCLVVLRVNARSARLTNIKMCTGDVG